MKPAFRKALILVGLLLLSVGFGLLFDAVMTSIERHRYPMPEEYREQIAVCADEYGVPETILWALVRNGSDFASNAKNGDRVGLTQLTAEEFSFVCTEVWGEEERDAGLLYDPETSLRAGAAYLSWLYRRYGVWDTVYAAYHAGTTAVDRWSLTEADSLGRINFPDEATADFVDEMNTAVEYYAKLYFQP